MNQLNDENPTVRSEKEILKFWESENIFQKSLIQREGAPFFSFYDGPPFATGQPHYGNLLPSTIKDVVLRYRTMRGNYAPRRVGWDCHGLPLENLAEKELKQKNKADIEKLGIDKFNETCNSLVFRCLPEFEKILKRMGRWADYENYYATVDPLYTESIWWIFKYLYDKELIYQAYRTSPYCPRCGTPLSNFELNQPGAYRDIEDTSIFVKFPLNKNTFLLVWTTTPWTLPANFALAVNTDAEYVKVKQGEQFLILATERLSVLTGECEEIERFRGEALIGQKYEAIYPMEPSNGRDYQIVSADFVSMEEGTGLVHLAAFGLEDMEVAKEKDLPLKITVDLEGRVLMGHNLPGQGKLVWEADSDVLADLEAKGLLYQKMKIKHSYPFCWRCDERLIYYPITSWYIAVEKFRDQLVANNEQINWVPGHLKKGRFGKWLEGARDWAVSRNRYWGAPLPVWISESGEIKVIGSREDLMNQKFSDNHYWLMRHGEAENNVKKLLVDSEVGYPLTEAGRKQVEESISELKDLKIDTIWASPTLRTKETAEIVGKALNIKPEFFKELGERKFGIANEQKEEIYRKVFNSPEDYLTHSPEGGETGLELKKRVYDFIKKQDQQCQNKNILIISHRGVLRALQSACLGLTDKEYTVHRQELGLDLGEIKEMKFVPMPINNEGRIDFHRPYIDQVVFYSEDGKKMKRIEEVFDCWYESGAMPYAQNHFPFENQEETKASFPADFITEALEQTRGWFYTLHVLATALTLEDIGLGKNRPAFKNAVAHGLILTETGEKLSKHLANYTPPTEILDKYGADALRFYFLSRSSLGGNYVIDEIKIREVAQKVISTLDNCVQFYLTYASKEESSVQKIESDNLLDQWIISRIHKVGRSVVNEMDKYHVDKAARSFLDLIDDLSNWYVRRSRSRLQNYGPETDKAAATLRMILLEVSRLIAPFTPFIAEKSYRSLRHKDQLESVHLLNYFEVKEDLINEPLEKEMAQVREIVRLTLQARAKAGYKVRQPLSELQIKGKPFDNQQLEELIIDEVNVKKVQFVDSLSESEDWIKIEENELSVALSIQLTPELEAEGLIREIIRAIQSMRKESGLTPQDQINVHYQGSDELAQLIEENKDSIQKENRAQKIQRLTNGDLSKFKKMILGERELYLAIES